MPDGLDEDDLLDELDALELDMLEEEAELTDGVPSYLQDEALPEAPEEEPVVLPGGRRRRGDRGTGDRARGARHRVSVAVRRLDCVYVTYDVSRVRFVPLRYMSRNESSLA